MRYERPFLDELETEAIFVLREVAGQFENAVLLFSGGKDSITLVHLMRKAFAPAALPFPLLHIDTGHNFPEVLAFRDRLSREHNCRLVIRCVQDSIDAGRAVDETGPRASRNVIQTVTLRDAIAELKIDAAIGGARRDEEKARAKERVFSHRNEFGQWEPRNQRPELWQLYNGRRSAGEHFRVFPLSNWTEIDVWLYIERERLTLPSLYFAHRRAVFERDGLLIADTPYVARLPHEVVSERTVRFRTVGDATCTSAMESNASTVADVLDELRTVRVSERGGRSDDRRSDSAMEERKRAGYF